MIILRICSYGVGFVSEILRSAGTRSFAALPRLRVAQKEAVRQDRGGGAEPPGRTRQRSDFFF